jgi:hypothetical protein
VALVKEVCVTLPLHLKKHQHVFIHFFEAFALKARARRLREMLSIERDGDGVGGCVLRQVRADLIRGRGCAVQDGADRMGRALRHADVTLGNECCVNSKGA